MPGRYDMPGWQNKDYTCDKTRMAPAVWPSLILFSLMIFVPTAYGELKAGFLAAVIFIIIVNILRTGYINLSFQVLIWNLVIIATGLFFILLGLVKGAPGALNVGTVYVLWPLVYTILIAGIIQRETVDSLIRVLVFVTLAIGLYSLSYILYANGWLPEALYVRLDQGQKIVLEDGIVEYNLHNISTLLFTVPFAISSLMIWPKKAKIPVPRLLLWAAVFSAMIPVLLSGRRALLLSVMVSPFLVLLFRMFLKKEYKQASRKGFITAAAGLLIAAACLYRYFSMAFGFDIHELMERFKQGFDFVTDGSGYVRREQFFALLRGWLENPLFGTGHGAYTTDIVRSHKQPWAYELSYLTLLFHTGIIGFSIYAAWVVWIFRTGIRIIRSGHHLCLHMLSVLVGTSSFLIANATNPYLDKFDYLWVVFFPVAIINLWFLNKDR